MSLLKSESIHGAFTWLNAILWPTCARVRTWLLAEFKEARFNYIRFRAEKGDAHSQYQLGLIYERGEHGLRSDYEAHKWFLKAAFQGMPEAQAKACEFSRDGRGVPRNDQEAFNWCRKAAEQGHPLSQLRLGEMYRHGIGVERNPKEARKWEDKVSTQKIPLPRASRQPISTFSR
jgi:TPR repeat protein